MYIGSDDLANFTFAVTRSYYEALKMLIVTVMNFLIYLEHQEILIRNIRIWQNFMILKENFGDEYIEFIGEFDLVNNKILYKMLPIMLSVYRKLRRK